MRLLIQRVKEASVTVGSDVVGSIGRGLLVFVGVTHQDTEEQAVWLSNKLVHLRIFEDEQGKTNRSLLDQGGEVLVVSQFTLYADCTTGRRPSFTEAAAPQISEELYRVFIEELRKKGVVVKTGIFGAYMQVSLVNDGPFTVILDS